jgi:hypothetical protein
MLLVTLISTTTIFIEICSSEIEVEIYFKNGENGKACRKVKKKKKL